MRGTMMRRLLACAALTATAASGLLLAGAGAAQAWPQGCSTQAFSWYGQAYCTTGTGAFRVKVTCLTVFGSTQTHYGPWAAPGRDVSQASCAFSDDRVTNVAVEKRNP